MSYDYETEKPKVFLEHNQKMFLRIRDNADHLMGTAGAAMLGHIISGVSGDSWEQMACVDRLVEIGELVEIKYGACAGQRRIFCQKRA